jgi:hypothetical protein
LSPALFAFFAALDGDFFGRFITDVSGRLSRLHEILIQVRAPSALFQLELQPFRTGILQVLAPFQQIDFERFADVVAG